jgi:hypothetical protein
MFFARLQREQQLNHQNKIMKCNAWTLALIGAGLVSLPAVSQAEEKPSPVVTAVNSTTLSGYVDTSAQWNPGTGDKNLPPYQFGGASKADGFNLDVVKLSLEKPVDAADLWGAGYKVDLLAGPDANVYNTASFFGNGSKANNNDFAIKQAYVALHAPVGNGIDFKVGVFDTILGYEVFESGNNPNYSRSYGYTIEPQTHTGILGTYQFTEVISASAGVANTFGPSINDREYFTSDSEHTESHKTYMGSITLTAPKSLGFLAGSTLSGGVVNGFNSGADDNVTSYYAGTTINTPLSWLKFGAAFDDYEVHGVSGENWTAAGYASIQATEKLSFYARAEYMKDRGDAKVFRGIDGNGDLFDTAPDEVMALTGTVQYDLWKNVLSRLEVRWDHALNGATWGNGQDQKNAVMIAANVIYKF